MVQPKKQFLISNYVLWGRMFRLAHELSRNVPFNFSFTKTEAVETARFYKAVFRHDVFNKYASEAAAFVKFGYDGDDPSSTALPLAASPGNVASVQRFKWKWIGLHDDEQ